MRNPFRYIESRASEEGTEQEKLVTEVYKPFRQKEYREYRDGKVPLDFQHQFSSGETFRAIEHEGIADITLQRGGTNLFSFSDFVPPETRFVTPRFLNRLRPGLSPIDPLRYEIGQFLFVPNKKIISVGYFAGPQSIFDLVHEIGHARLEPEKDNLLKKNIKHTAVPHPKLGKSLDEVLANLDQETIKMLKQYSEQMDQYYASVQDPIHRLKNEQEINSVLERLAWAEALHLIRRIYGEYSVNLLEAFPDFEAVQREIKTSLLTHRYQAEKNLHPGPIGFCKLTLGIAPTKEDLVFLRKLFDKSKRVQSKKK